MIKNLFLLFILVLMFGCSTTGVSKYKVILIKENKGKIKIVNDVVSGSTCKLSVNESGINNAIKDALKARYPEAIGMANLAVMQETRMDIIIYSRCFRVKGNPVLSVSR